MTLPIDMDHNATTPVAPDVFEAMRPFFAEQFGNPASRSHRFGWSAEAAVAVAREQVARLIGARPEEIVFTSGATESNTLALTGVAQAYRDGGGHLVTTSFEHHAVLDPCRRLEREGFAVTVLPVDREGLVDPGAVRRAITPGTILVSVMLANNEIGGGPRLRAGGGGGDPTAGLPDPARRGRRGRAGE